MRGIGLRELHSAASQILHVWRPVEVVPWGPLFRKGHGSILPSHVIHEEEDDVDRPRIHSGDSRRRVAIRAARECREDETGREM